jgi:hypothetical protein
VRARSVNTARGAIAGCHSVHVVVGHWSSAAPQPLPPPQPRRTTRDRQIPHDRLAAAVRDRPNAAAVAAHHGPIGFHERLELAVDLGDVEQHKARQSEQADSISVTLSHS